MQRLRPVVLTIAGSDSSGGAGIQADLKTFVAHGVYGTTVITAITAQNTLGIYGGMDVPEELIYLQAKAVFEDLPPSAVKIGMLSKKETVITVVKILKEFKPRWVILDPVMVSTSGTPLLHQQALPTLKEELIPLVNLLTPNIPETESILQKRVTSLGEMKEAAKVIVETLGAKAVLIKGGHLLEDPVDILYDGKHFFEFPGQRLTVQKLHGTGCTLSSAICANLALGYDLATSVKRAKDYVNQAIDGALKVGKGALILNHLRKIGLER